MRADTDDEDLAPYEDVEFDNAFRGIAVGMFLGAICWGVLIGTAAFLFHEVWL